MVTKVIQIWCEYDIDQEYQVFANEEAAIKFVNEGSADYTYEELEEDGLINFEWVSVLY